MMHSKWLLWTAAAWLSIAACGGDDDGNPPVEPDGGGDGDGDAGMVDGGDSGSPLAECEKPENLDRLDQLTGGQPEIGVRSKDMITTTISFASVADDPSVTCTVDLEFKDLNDNGELDPYEDWTLTPSERAEDLLGRMALSEKMGLMAHATITDTAGSSDPSVSAALQTAIADHGVRFGQVTDRSSQLTAKANWANEVQALCEASALGIPFVLSLDPSHSEGNGRDRVSGFSRWPHELGLGATGDPEVVETFGQVVAQEYRALGIRMALSPAADLATEPRWHNAQFTFGEDSARAGELVSAYIRGLQGETLGGSSVAAVAGHFPGAGAAKDGWDARFEKGKYLAYPGDNLDEHLTVFEAAIEAGVSGVMPSYGVLEGGPWSGADGALDGATIEQVGASFNGAVINDALRDHHGFSGLVLAPRGVLEDAAVDPLGAPWGMEDASRAERVAKAINAGVDQFGGLNDPTPIADAMEAEQITGEQIDTAAARALALMFQLQLFENPYVDADQAPARVNTDDAYRAGLNAMNRSMVLLVNEDKPQGFLNGEGDGTQQGDKGNAGNGSLKVLPAPPGEPYVAAGCSYYVMGNFDLDYVRSVSAGYGELTNDVTSIDGIDVSTPEERIARSDYVFIRVDAPFTADPDTGPFAYGTQALEYANNDNASVLSDLEFARDAIDALDGSAAQIVVGVDAGRPAVVSEILSYGVSGLYISWGVSDKVFLDVAFGIVDGTGILPVGLAASDEAAGGQQEDVAGDGADETFVENHGLSTEAF